MTKKEGLSPRAKAAVKLVDLWSLFFTPEITAKIVRYTNDKIQETLDKRRWTKEDLKKKPHVKFVDLVRTSTFSQCLFDENPPVNARFLGSDSNP